jgi:hypothetical protein
MAVSGAACMVGLAAAGMGDLEAVGMAGLAVAGMVAEEEAATGNQICGGEAVPKQEDRNGGKHDDADKRQRTKSSLVDCC